MLRLFAVLAAFAVAAAFVVEGRRVADLIALPGPLLTLIEPTWGRFCLAALGLFVGPALIVLAAALAGSLVEARALARLDHLVARARAGRVAAAEDVLGALAGSRFETPVRGVAMALLAASQTSAMLWCLPWPPATAIEPVLRQRLAKLDVCVSLGMGIAVAAAVPLAMALDAVVRTGPAGDLVSDPVARAAALAASVLLAAGLAVIGLAKGAGAQFRDQAARCAEALAELFPPMPLASELGRCVDRLERIAQRLEAVDAPRPAAQASAAAARSISRAIADLQGDLDEVARGFPELEQAPSRRRPG